VPLCSGCEGGHALNDADFSIDVRLLLFDFNVAIDSPTHLGIVNVLTLVLPGTGRMHVNELIRQCAIQRGDVAVNHRPEAPRIRVQ
jgi:hypothetical protein